MRGGRCSSRPVVWNNPLMSGSRTYLAGMVALGLAAILLWVGSASPAVAATEEEILKAVDEIVSAARAYDDLPRDEAVYRFSARILRLEGRIALFENTAQLLESSGEAGSFAEKERKNAELARARLKKVRDEARQAGVRVDDPNRILEAAMIRDLADAVEKSREEYDAGRLTLEELEQRTMEVSLVLSWGGHGEDLMRREFLDRYDPDRTDLDGL